MMVKNDLVLYFEILLKPLQNKKGQKNLGYPTKNQSYIRTAFLSGALSFFGPSCFEAALAPSVLPANLLDQFSLSGQFFFFALGSSNSEGAT